MFVFTVINDATASHFIVEISRKISTREKGDAGRCEEGWRVIGAEC
jgi:hypothetical protein